MPNTIYVSLPISQCPRSAATVSGSVCLPSGQGTQSAWVLRYVPLGQLVHSVRSAGLRTNPAGQSSVMYENEVGLHYDHCCHQQYHLLLLLILFILIISSSSSSSSSSISSVRRNISIITARLRDTSIQDKCTCTFCEASGCRSCSYISEGAGVAEVLTGLVLVIVPITILANPLIKTVLAHIT